MILYHGSNVAVPEPKILPNLRALDFGSGFYLTSNFHQNGQNWFLKDGNKVKRLSMFVIQTKALRCFSIKIRSANFHKVTVFLTMKSIAMIFLRNGYQKNRALWAASFQAA